MRKFLASIFLGAVLVGTCGFSTQPPSDSFGQPVEERKAQDALPKSNDPMWTVLSKSKIHVNEKKGLYSATHPAAVKALVGTQVSISGFMLPLESTEKFKHYILSKRTPTCPFCPPGEPNEIVDIWMAKPVKYDENMVKVTGNFALMDNEQLGMFFKLSNASFVGK
jgi:hypothetical protein